MSILLFVRYDTILLVGWLAELTRLDGYMDRNEIETTPHEEEVLFPSALLMIVGC